MKCIVSVSHDNIVMLFVQMNSKMMFLNMKKWIIWIIINRRKW